MRMFQVAITAITLLMGTEIFAADFEGACQVTNLFESSNFVMKDEGDTFTFTYDGSHYALHYPDTTKPMTEMGLLKDGERIKFLRVKFIKTQMHVHPTDAFIREVHSGNTILELGVTKEPFNPNAVIDVRTADLHWASLYMYVQRQVHARGENVQRQAVFGFRTKGSQDFKIDRELHCNGEAP